MLRPASASPMPGATPPRSAKTAAPKRLAVFGKAAKEFATTPPSVLVASFLANLLALALPLTLLQIYDRILPNAAIHTLVALLLALLTVIICDIALRLLRDGLTTQIALEKAFRGRTLAFATLANADPARLREQPGRFWLDRMSAVEEVASVKESAEKALFVDLPFVFIFLGMTALIGGWLVAVPVAVIALLVAVMFWMTGRQRQLLEDRREEDEKRYTQIAEWLTGIGTIKGLAMETLINRRFEAMLARGVAYSYHAVLENNRVPMAGLLFSNLMMVAVSTAGAMRVIESDMSIGTLACCSLLATRVAQPVFRVVTIAAQLQSVALTEARAQTVYDLPVTGAPSDEPAQGLVRMFDVSLPGGAAGGGFRALNMLAEPGEIIGIVGPLGSGKTAFLSLVEGRLAPASGRVLIDEWDATSPQMRARARAVQRIDGRVSIFRGTILENVAMFRTGPYIAEAVAAIEAIGLDAQINKLPEGYDTRIGDGAPLVLPHGFQQALMIARALAQEPSVLLVSEIGALLDLDNFRRLEHALQRMPDRPTTILASQRGGVFNIASRIYEIRDGRLHLLGDVLAAARSAERREAEARLTDTRIGDVKSA